MRIKGYANHASLHSSAARAMSAAEGAPPTFAEGGLEVLMGQPSRTARFGSLQAGANDDAGKYGCPYVVKVSQKNFGFENGVLNVPLYAASLVAEAPRDVEKSVREA